MNVDLPPVEVRELTEAEGRDLFDRRCREMLSMTGADFLARYDAGQVECWQWPADELLILLPFARRS